MLDNPFASNILSEVIAGIILLLIGLISPVLWFFFRTWVRANVIPLLVGFFLGGSVLTASTLLIFFPSTPKPDPPHNNKPPSADQVSYRIRTNYAGFSSDVEFSVFVNDVQVGAYHSDRATADITRFIKPGRNKVRIAWTADPNMDSAFSATLIIEKKQGEEWSDLITRKVTKTTKAGEITQEFFNPGTTPR